MTQREATGLSSFAVLALFIASSYLLSPTPAAAQDWSAECTSADQSIAEAKTELPARRRTKEMDLGLDRIHRLNEALKAKASGALPESFLRTCLQKTIEAFSTHRKFMPPSERQKAHYLATVGSFYREFGKLKEANENYQLALKASPEDAQIRWDAFRIWLDYSLSLPVTAQPKADTVRRADDFIARAREMMQPLVNGVAPNQEARERQLSALRFFAKFLEAANEPTLAFEEWKRLLKLAPSDPQANAKVVTYYLARADLEAAQGVLERLVKEEKPEPFYVENLARLYLRQGQATQATAMLARFAGKGTPAMDTLYVEALGESGRAPEAEKFLKSLPEARRRDPKVAEVESKLSVFRARRNMSMGMRGAAVADFMRYLKTHAGDREVTFEAARVLQGGTPQDRRLAARLINPFALKAAALTDAQLELAVESLAAAPDFRESTALVCERMKQEREKIPVASRLGCVDAWLRQDKRELAKSELEATLNEVRGTPDEKIYLKRLTEF